MSYSTDLMRNVVVETFLAGKSPDVSVCEDALVVSNAFIGVVDGATFKGPSPVPPTDVSPGRTVAQLIAGAIADLSPDIPARAAIDNISALVKRRVRGLDRLSQSQAAAAIAIVSVARREIWRVGDCLLRIGDKEITPRLSIDNHIAAVRACHNATFLIDGWSLNELRAEDPGRNLVLPLLERKYRFRNLDSDQLFGFGAIDGSPVPDRFIEVYAVPSSDCDIVVCTDGYPRALGTLAASEAHLADLLERDPLCIKDFISTKGVKPGDVSFDDRAYIRVRL